jgi:cell wall-associated NlpC family hydrolase
VILRRGTAHTPAPSGQGLGKRLPRVSHDQYRHSRKVGRDVRRGELVFFRSGGGRVHHVRIYAGSGRIWHAPEPGGSVRLEQIWTRGWTTGRY